MSEEADTEFYIATFRTPGGKETKGTMMVTSARGGHHKRVSFFTERNANSWQPLPDVFTNGLE